MLGYRVDVIEFVSTEHTPKNLMLRAERAPSRRATSARRREYVELRDRWGVEPAIERLRCPYLQGAELPFLPYGKGELD